ncbi:hypothetical protein MSIBF_A2160008 [groundwater metagenome]|uniref:Uncharacterized protein n=1 Tax=groundwater metagenome TaxID=717931 RepID=A0A098E8J8_9ZZZZ
MREKNICPTCIELLGPFGIRTGPNIIPVVVVPVVFSGIVFVVLMVILFLYPLFPKIDIVVIITKILFAISFWIVIIKTVLDFSLFAPEKHLKRPEEFMKNHEDPNLLYFYDKDADITCKHGQTIFCVSEPGTSPHELINQFTLDGLRNGEYCIYVLSARDIGTIIKQLVEQKKEIEDKILQLNANSDEMKRFIKTMKICHHNDYLKNIMREIIMKRLNTQKKHEVANFISKVTMRGIGISTNFKDALELEAEHRNAEEILRERDLTKLKDFILKDLVEKKFKEKTGTIHLNNEIINKLNTEFKINPKEATEIANAIISEAKYYIYRNEYKKVITENVEVIVNQIISGSTTFNKIKSELKKISFDLMHSEEKRLQEALEFKSNFEKDYCIFKSGGRFKEIFKKIRKQLKLATTIRINFRNDTSFFDNIKEILKLNKKEKEEIRKIIDTEWKDFFKKHLNEIKDKDYRNYPYYYEQYRELSRLRWFFSDIEDYTETDNLVFIDAFIRYRGMKERERQNLYIGEKKIVFRSLWSKFRSLWFGSSHKDKIIVRKYEINPGSISSLHRTFRRIRNDIFSISTEGGVYIEGFCNRRIAFNMFSDLFEAADVNQIFQLIEHEKVSDETITGTFEFIAIKPDEFEDLETLYKDMDKLSTVVSDIYIRLENSGKKDPRAKVRIKKHHDRNEETKDNYYDLCEKHGWLYLEGCEHEEKKLLISEILKKISSDGRSKLSEDIKDMVESEKRKSSGGGETRKDKETMEDIREILEKEGLSRSASEILLRAIVKEPQKILYEIKGIEKQHSGEAHEEYLKEHEESSKEHGEILDVAFLVVLSTGTYIMIEEFILFFGI